MYNKLIDYLDENTEIVWTTTGDLKTKYTTTFNDKIEVLFLNNDTGSLSVTSLENLYKYYYDDRYLFLMFKEFIKKCEELFPKWVNKRLDIKKENLKKILEDEEILTEKINEILNKLKWTKNIESDCDDLEDERDESGFIGCYRWMIINEKGKRRTIEVDVTNEKFKYFLKIIMRRKKLYDRLKKYPF